MILTVDMRKETIEIIDIHKIKNNKIFFLSKNSLGLLKRMLLNKVESSVLYGT